MAALFGSQAYESSAVKRFYLCFVHKFATNPHLNLVSGFILLFCGALETFASLTEDLIWTPFGIHHGIAFYGFIQMLKALPDTMKALRMVDDGDIGLTVPVQAKT